MCVRISSVRRVLQFTPHNAVSCVLHRSAIRVIHRLQSYRLFIELTSATIFKFQRFETSDSRRRQSVRSPNSCDSANAYTSLAPATEVEGTPRAEQTKTRDRTQNSEESLRRHCFAEQQPRTRHRTKLGTQWDRSGLRPTLGHFLSRSVETQLTVSLPP